MLSRGLPLSVLVHLLGLTLLVVFGNRVATAPVRPPRAISVRMVQLPQPQAPAQQAAEEPRPQQPQEEIKEDLPPKELPEPKPDPEPVVEDPQPEVKVSEPEPEPEAESPDPVEEITMQAPRVASVGGTDEDFPFAWYIKLTEDKIFNNWKPRQLGFGKRAVVSCAIHFRIARNGTVSQVTLVRNSGVGVYDREALRAVKTTRLPPLPPQYKGTSLGITYIFNMKPEN
jgi:protein TonB